MKNLYVITAVPKVSDSKGSLETRYFLVPSNSPEEAENKTIEYLDSLAFYGMYKFRYIVKTLSQADLYEEKVIPI